jgi:hypothetical protein
VKRTLTTVLLGHFLSLQGEEWNCFMLRNNRILVGYFVAIPQVMKPCVLGKPPM